MKLIKIALAAAAVLGLSLSAHALTIGDAQHAWYFDTSTLGANAAGTPLTHLSGGINDYNNLAAVVGLVNTVVNPDYLLTDGVFAPGGTPGNVGNQFAVATGWDYVLVRYDGPNGGLVLFKLDGNGGSIPFFGYDLFTSGSTDSYGVSHYSLVGAHTTSVPDGGTTAALLGLGLVGMSFVARRRLTA